MKIALSTDHAGFDQLKLLEKFLSEQGHQCVNFGPEKFDAEDDYPDFIFPAAEAVTNGECEVGIIMGGSGQGEAMAANRVKGVRCMVYYGPAQAAQAIDAEGKQSADEYEILRLSRAHNNANMISIAARFVSQSEIEKAVTIWLEEQFSGAERHERRIKKLDK
ncbi:MAG TPA: RpiB/LacA/LacB family sugar-phosphate isomerase [Candidatus Saccharimonadales bacterium]|nr:RpiB/LacA/LacB family sugar-phosphate isomerase [Candidatus Saccharimonadales bacterium]